VVEFNVFPSKKKKKKKKEKCVYMNIHYYVTKPQLFKIKLLNRIIVIKGFLKQLIGLLSFIKD
jgi:hypothetical protein